MRDTLSPIFVTKPLPSEKEFSIVSLVATQERYDRLLRSLAAKGFSDENSEFLAIDNRNGNSFDGYSALRGVLPGLSGRYVLFTHDDIELISDGIDELRRLLAKLEALDPKWMLAGNAGGVFIGSGDTHFLHLDDPHGGFRLPTSDPVRVWGLDENFLVMPRHRMPLPSLDFSGFHLFATDMCLQARAAGGTSYVIPFLLRHHGKGLVDGTYPRAQERLERKYSQLSIKGRIQTPAAALAFGWRAKLNAFLSRQGQRLYRIKAKFGRLFARLSRHSRRS